MAGFMPSAPHHHHHCEARRKTMGNEHPWVLLCPARLDPPPKPPWSRCINYAPPRRWVHGRSEICISPPLSIWISWLYIHTPPVPIRKHCFGNCFRYEHMLRVFHTCTKTEIFLPCILLVSCQGAFGQSTGRPPFDCGPYLSPTCCTTSHPSTGLQYSANLARALPSRVVHKLCLLES